MSIKNYEAIGLVENAGRSNRERRKIAKVALNEKIDFLRLQSVSEEDLKEMKILNGRIKRSSIVPSSGSNPSRIAQDGLAPRFYR